MVEILRYPKCHHSLKSINSMCEDVTAFTFLMWIHFFNIFIYFFNFFCVCIFNWRIIALQYWFGFCHAATWINHRYTYVPSLLKLPPTSIFKVFTWFVTISFLFYVLVFWPRGTWCGILVPRPGLEPSPPALEGEVLTTGQQGKSLQFLKSAK